MPAKKTTANHNSLLDLMEAFPDEDACIAHLEQLRWPTGIVCPRCGSTRKIHKLARGNYKCSDCRNQFSVRKGTIFEESRLPLRKWFAASWLVTANRKGISSCQLAREIGVTQKTAWFMLSRLREVAGAANATGGTMGGDVEADETYIGGKAKNMHRTVREAKIKGRGTVGKLAIAGVMERTGRAKTALIEGTNREQIADFLSRNVSADANLYTDEHPSYRNLGYKHEAVNHSFGEYVRGLAHTNGIESYWSLLKRGHYGIYHKMSAKHIHRYLAEYEARWNMMRQKLNGAERVDTMLESAPGLRLTYARLIK